MRGTPTLTLAFSARITASAEGGSAIDSQASVTRIIGIESSVRGTLIPNIWGDYSCGKVLAII